MDLYSYEIFGWLAASCFGLCAIPQAYKSFKEKHSNGISWGFIVLWFLGEIFAIIYVAPRKDIPLLTNYILNVLFVAVVIYYKIKGANNEKK